MEFPSSGQAYNLTISNIWVYNPPQIIYLETKMNILSKINAGRVLQWLISVLFLFIAFVFLVGGELAAGVFSLLAGISALPTFWKYLSNKYNFQTKRWLKILIFIVFVWGFVANVPESKTTETSESLTQITAVESTATVTVVPTATPAPSKKELIEKQFSVWDGSHNELTKMIKDSLNDPDSYEHLNTNYWDFEDHIVVKTEFTAKNGFGGRVRNMASAKIYLSDGRIEDFLIY